jgi:uncharacterized surface protein with fasciclin (FAS1) repeats
MKISNLLTILSIAAPTAAAAVDRKRVRKVYTANKTSRALQPGMEQGMKPGEAVPAASMSMSMSASMGMSVPIEVGGPEGIPAVTTTVAAPTTIGIVPIDEAPEPSMSMSMSMSGGSGDTIYDLGVANPDFSTLVMLVDAAGLSDVLSGEGPFTLFAPTNEAFDAALAAMPEGFLDQLLAPENVSQLQSLLTYHVLDGAVYSTDATSGEVTTVEGEPITVTVDNGGVMINDAHVVTGDILASNGVIHVLDKVLVPAAFTLDDAVTTVAAPTTVAEGVTTAASTTAAAVEGVITTAAATETKTTVASVITTVADETTADATTTAPVETVSPTAAPAPKSSAMNVGTTLAAMVVSCGAIAITV